MIDILIMAVTVLGPLSLLGFMLFVLMAQK